MQITKGPALFSSMSGRLLYTVCLYKDRNLKDIQYFCFWRRLTNPEALWLNVTSKNKRPDQMTAVKTACCTTA